jgi:hypothetical protein
VAPAAGRAAGNDRPLAPIAILLARLGTGAASVIG